MCLLQGVIATHRITASSPDTDLLTVQQLRVGRRLKDGDAVFTSVVFFEKHLV